MSVEAGVAIILSVFMKRSAVTISKVRSIDRRRYQDIRKALSDLEEQEQKNNGRVVHALDMFEELQRSHFRPRSLWQCTS